MSYQQPAAEPEEDAPERRPDRASDSLQTRNGALSGYLREKVNQLLDILGTWPLQPEALDDLALIELDPIGIIADSFEQVLEHLRETNNSLSLAHDEIRAIFAAAGAPIVIVDPEQHVLGYNDRARDLPLRSADGSLGQPLAALSVYPLVPTDPEFFPRIVSAGVAVQRPDFIVGNRHYQLVGTPVLGQDGVVSKVVLVYTDITERSAMEAALKEAERRLKTIIDSVPVGILVVDAESQRITDANQSAATILGYRREELPGNLCHGISCSSAADCGTNFDSSERQLVHSDGRLIPVVKTVTTVELDGRRCLLESFVDISQRKETENALAESEERYRSLYSTMKEGVALHEMIFDDAGRPVDYTILDVNPAYESILGVGRNDALGMLGSRIYGEGDPPYLECFAAVVRTGRPQTFETSFRGRYFYISVVRPVEGKFATIFDDITERKQAEQQVQELAYSDMLTNLPNRALLLDRLREATARCAREGTRVAVLFLDLDRFKPINDTLGHAVGDTLLKHVAQRLRHCVRESDTVARLGGDEFVVLLTRIQRDLDATRAARQILERLSEPFYCDGHEIFSSLSIGIALFPADGREPGTLLKNADMAMYVAKERGRNTYQFFCDEMNRAAQERLTLENSLRRALKEQEFFLCYQPQLTLGEGCVTGVEALVRWNHPEEGLIPPGRFIPVCEEMGLILPLGEWVLRTACLQARAWEERGNPPIRVAINLSSMQFRQGDLTRRLQAIIDETGVDPSLLELELTESMIMEDADETVRTLQSFKKMGVRLAIDDFGTGYSSLSYLSSFPIDRIKIAQRFVQALPHDTGDAAIVETVIAIAKSLDIDVIAEGVETREQLEFLWSRGCREVQGFYFARPIAGDRLTTYFGEWLNSTVVCPYRLD